MSELVFFDKNSVLKLILYFGFDLCFRFSLLLDGLHAVEKAQEWYFKQIALIQEKMKSLGRGDGHLVSK